MTQNEKKSRLLQTGFLMDGGPTRFATERSESTEDFLPHNRYQVTNFYQANSINVDKKLT